MKKILITGSSGFVGRQVIKNLDEDCYILRTILKKKNNNLFNNKKSQIETIISDDLFKEDVSWWEEKCKDIEIIIHLAWYVEPGNHLQSTKNFDCLTGTLNLIEGAIKSGVKRFIYSSSQSMYGIADLSKDLNEDDSEKNPVTAYAKAKWDAELYLNSLNSTKFSVVCFRPSTVFGASPRLRTDLFFNNLVACAFTTGIIEIKSDGSPWRPIVHVRDVCNAFIAGIEAPINLVAGKAFNVGIKNGNYTVKQIAEAAQKAVPNSKLIFTNEHTDPRTYKVSFDRILINLKDYYKPEWNLEKGGYELVRFFKKIKFTEEQFKSRNTIRLMQLQYLTEIKSINSELRKIK